MSISNYSRTAEQPGTARQIVALGIAFAIVVVGLIAFNLTLERVSLLDDLKKDVTALASGIPSFLGMGEVDPDVWHLKYRSTEAAM